MRITVGQLRRLIVEAISTRQLGRTLDFPFEEYLADPRYKGVDSDQELSKLDALGIAQYLAKTHGTTLYKFWKSVPAAERITTDTRKGMSGVRKLGATKSPFEDAVEDTILSDPRLRNRLNYSKPQLFELIDEICKKLNKIFEKMPMSPPPLPKR